PSRGHGELPSPLDLHRLHEPELALRSPRRPAAAANPRTAELLCPRMCECELLSSFGYPREAARAPNCFERSAHDCSFLGSIVRPVKRHASALAPARLKPCRLRRQQNYVPSDAAGVCDRVWLSWCWLVDALDPRGFDRDGV